MSFQNEFSECIGFENNNICNWPLLKLLFCFCEHRKRQVRPKQDFLGRIWSQIRGAKENAFFREVQIERKLKCSYILLFVCQICVLARLPVSNNVLGGFPLSGKDLEGFPFSSKVIDNIHFGSTRVILHFIKLFVVDSTSLECICVSDCF